MDEKTNLDAAKCAGPSRCKSGGAGTTGRTDRLAVGPYELTATEFSKRYGLKLAPSNRQRLLDSGVIHLVEVFIEPLFGHEIRMSAHLHDLALL